MSSAAVVIGALRVKGKHFAPRGGDVLFDLLTVTLGSDFRISPLIH